MSQCKAVSTCFDQNAIVVSLTLVRPVEQRRQVVTRRASCNVGWSFGICSECLLSYLQIHYCSNLLVIYCNSLFMEKLLQGSNIKIIFKILIAMVSRQVVALYNHSFKKKFKNLLCARHCFQCCLVFVFSAKDIAVRNTQKNKPAFIRPVFQ